MNFDQQKVELLEESGLKTCAEKIEAKFLCFICPNFVQVVLGEASWWFRGPTR